jgi:hypothetical protein
LMMRGCTPAWMCSFRAGTAETAPTRPPTSRSRARPHAGPGRSEARGLGRAPVPN